MVGHRRYASRSRPRNASVMPRESRNRRFSICRIPELHSASRPHSPAIPGIETDAECNSAIQQSSTLRYARARLRHYPPARLPICGPRGGPIH